MSPRLEQVLDHLRQADGVDDFVVLERAGVRRERGPGRRARDLEERHIDVTIFRDHVGGRGVARARIPAAIGDDPDLLRAHLGDTIARAAVALGPVWASPPPAAPARVQVADPAIADLDGAMSALAAQVDTVDDQARDVRVLAIERWQCALHTQVGLASSYPSTLVSARAQLAAGAVDAEPALACARRLRDLDWPSAYREAERRRQLRARARATPPGRYDIILTGAALIPTRLPLAAPERPRAGLQPPLSLAPGGDPIRAFGWFAPLLAQADSELIRLGLSRYRPGQAVYHSGLTDGARGAAAEPPEPLTLGVDGTIPYGLRSRPFGDLGAPTRRQTLIADGIAQGSLRSLRAAAGDAALASGGVANLVLAAGRTPPTVLRAAGPTARPVLEISALSWLDPDPLTGELHARIDLGLLDDGTATMGGVLRGNLFSWLTRARYSSQLADHGWYLGPEAIRVDDVWVA